MVYALTNEQWAQLAHS